MQYTQFASSLAPYQHGIQVNRMLEFHECRIWLQETWGWHGSVAPQPDYQNPYWSYHIEYSNYMIYLQGDEELSWFRMRWG
jgi:hypothetical protein